MQEMKIEYMDIDKLTPYENNPRNNDEAVKYVANSIKEFGFKNPIIIDKDNVVVAGHTRLKAAKNLGIKKVPVIRADDLTQEQIKAFRIADNKVSEIATWDLDKLNIELQDIDLDMCDFGFDDFEIGSLDLGSSQGIIEDEVPEVEEEPKSKYGDIYQLGNHRLMCGDSTKIEDVEKLMNGVKADMVFTDPPYNVAIGSKNAFLNSVHPFERCCEDIINDKGMTDEEIGESLWKPAFANMREVAKDHCSIYITMPQGGTHMMVMMMMMESGWQVKHELIWIKNAPTFSMGRLDYDYQHEPICYGWNKSHIFYGKGQQNKSIWNFDRPKKCNLHPTMKPIPLITNALLNSSKSDDVILDTFGGSGSTLIACEQLNRKCYMMELDPHYVDVIIKRWEQFTGKEAVKLNG